MEGLGGAARPPVALGWSRLGGGVSSYQSSRSPWACVRAIQPVTTSKGNLVSLSLLL